MGDFSDAVFVALLVRLAELEQMAAAGFQVHGQLAAVRWLLRSRMQARRLWRYPNEVADIGLPPPMSLQ